MEENQSQPILKQISQKVILWILFFIIIPAAIGWIVMRPILIKPARISLPEDDKRLEFVPVDLSQTPFKDSSEQLFGIPLRLKWYKFCLDNKNEVSLNELKIQLPYGKDTEAGAMEMKINFRGGTSYKIYAPVNEQVCEDVKTENFVADIVIEYRRPLPTSFDPAFKIVESNEKGDTAVIQQSAYVHTDKSTFTLINRWNEFIYKLLLLIGIWMAVLLNLRESWQIFNKK
ncbi:MAG: hypothetical protein HYT43_01520 [Candidatus Taylorbacteria bacterium]|nr:hypothetical protein [Candidatus Taylorbacteria bacterium]